MKDRMRKGKERRGEDSKVQNERIIFTGGITL